MSSRAHPLATVAVTALASLVLVAGGALAPAAQARDAAPPDLGTRTAGDHDRAARPLQGRLVVLDPGHQLGNHRFPRRIGRLVPAGGFRKPCNTTGTATRGGFPEATLVWKVARHVQKRLTALGARVVLTRHSNRQDRWGPCVDVRGQAGNARRADLKLSIHADGSDAPGAHGFHVIAPVDRRPWTHDIFRDSRRLARDTRSALVSRGLTRATYVAGGDGLDFRGDLATLNLSDVPTVMVELGNMRSRQDARAMTRPSGRARYASGLVDAVAAFLGRRS